MKKDKAVILLSGGLDSAVAAYWAKEHFKEAICLSIRYGQRHNKEVFFANGFSTKMGSPWCLKRLDLSNISKSALITPMEDVNKKVRGLPSSFVPGRNLFMLTIAGVLCYQHKIHNIVGGWNIVDYGGYPDCRPVFLKAAELALTTALAWRIHIHAPLVLMNKKHIIEEGIRLKVPFELTWSCYEGRSKPCGKCNACKNRAKGFKALKMEDPLLKG